MVICGFRKKIALVLCRKKVIKSLLPQYGKWNVQKITGVLSGCMASGLGGMGPG